LELKEGREGTLQHGPGAILEGAIGSCRDPTSFGWHEGRAAARPGQKHERTR